MTVPPNRPTAAASATPSAITNKLPFTVRKQTYLFAYDIPSDAPGSKRAARVRQTLQRWRLSGQYSVHETLLTHNQVQALTSELLEKLDRDQDLLLVGQLAAERPIQVFSRSPRKTPILGWDRVVSVPTHLKNGWYLVAYDVADPKRLQRVQKRVIQDCLAAQKSVYLFKGQGTTLVALLRDVMQLIKRREDDLRLYSLRDAQNLWFASGPLPSVVDVLPAPPTVAQPTIWERLVSYWRGTRGKAVE